MTDSIDDLAAAIRRALDADEALALEAPRSRWHIGNAVDPTKPCNVHTFPEARGVADGLNWLVAEHVARHNPERVLAEVASKRALLDEVIGWEHGLVRWDHNQVRACETVIGKPCDCGRDERVRAVLTHLAAPYQETP